jgi:Domain of unknown function (DUF3850)
MTNLETLTQAARDLVQKIDAIHNSGAYRSVWILNQIRNGPYQGQDYVAELDRVRELLSSSAPAGTAEPGADALREAARLAERALSSVPVSDHTKDKLHWKCLGCGTVAPTPCAEDCWAVAVGWALSDLREALSPRGGTGTSSNSNDKVSETAAAPRGDEAPAAPSTERLARDLANAAWLIPSAWEQRLAGRHLMEDIIEGRCVQPCTGCEGERVWKEARASLAARVEAYRDALHEVGAPAATRAEVPSDELVGYPVASTSAPDRWASLVTKGEANGCYPCDTHNGFRAHGAPCGICSLAVRDQIRRRHRATWAPPPAGREVGTGPFKVKVDPAVPPGEIRFQVGDKEIGRMVNVGTGAPAARCTLCGRIKEPGHYCGIDDEVGTGTPARGPAMHHVKTWPASFQAQIDGFKLFEVRWNDRDYQIGDTLVQKEWDPGEERYSGRELVGPIVYMVEGAFGLPPKLAVLGLVGRPAAPPAKEPDHARD